ncbi:hypothetical protein [Chengkuizengella axinellae]|uniref:Uncharacterized protein n=1 Tax=Chengkuizengella axinellae TaxID=3064388 RepID=A0ABT9J6S7_9BACL|nr:hypothetical protein [Chengkuizengella sp. 2205SS18-9]MDP5277183.1 hypothetical protein [Chengkuizengella sp. 2205SS18-9]
MKLQMKRFINIVLVLWVLFFITDLSLSKTNHSPIFAIPKVYYEDGGSTEYYGLGYKVIKYVNFTAERGPEVIKIDMGLWSMKFSDPLKKK